MARTIPANRLMNRTNRLQLEPDKRPYYVRAAPKIHVGYRRCAGPGSWSLLTEAGLERFALADDYETANGTTVMSYTQAIRHGLFMARGSGEKTATVAQALERYELKLAAEGRSKQNAKNPRNHLPQSLLDRPVSLLTELSDWRDSLIESGLALSSANRYAKGLKAALALVARRDHRIVNANAWRNGLRVKRIKGASNPPRDNFYVADGVILAIVRACEELDPEFGAQISVLAETGTRESQMLRIRPEDLRDEDPEAPKLLLWCSHKGRERDPEQRAVPITPALAKMLRKRAIARAIAHYSTGCGTWRCDSGPRPRSSASIRR